MMRVTRPGGWVEMLDATRFTSPNPAHTYLIQCLRRLYEHDGLILEPGSALARFLHSAGLKRVRARTVKVKAEAGRAGLGTSLSADLLAGMTAAGAAYVQAGIASEGKVRLALEQARRGESSAAIQITLTAAWGQRP